jgi:manganese/zinc/iron transport system substrate-binding protein
MKVVFIFWSFLLFSSCVWNKESVGNPRLVVCTTSIVGDAVQQLLGNRYTVKTLMGAGVDPHLYEAKPSDIRALGEARVIVYNGLHLEGKMTELFERMRREKDLIAFENGMPKNRLLKIGAHAYDPHVWFDPVLWLAGIEECALQLSLIFPEDQSFIMRNYARLKEDLLELKTELSARISDIRKEQRILITSHDAFHYFGRAFGVEVMAIQGVSTVTEPGLKDVSNLVRLIVKRKVRAIFVESSVSPKSIMAVIEGCAAQGHRVKVGGTLYSDALGDFRSKGGTYRGMMEANVAVLARAMMGNDTSNIENEGRK